MPTETLDRLGMMAHNTGYRCVHHSVENDVSHFPGGIEHKFDGVYVLFGSQHGYMWERAVCHYNSARPNELFIIEHFVAGAAPFIAYTRFLSFLEDGLILSRFMVSGLEPSRQTLYEHVT